MATRVTPEVYWQTRAAVQTQAPIQQVAYTPTPMPFDLAPQQNNTAIIIVGIVAIVGLVGLFALLGTAGKKCSCP